MMRKVPSDWVEFAPAFIDEVRLGLHASWEHRSDKGFGEMLIYWPEGADRPTGAWAVKRERVLGKPIPVIAHYPTDQATP